jgi:hypothetical protein
VHCCTAGEPCVGKHQHKQCELHGLKVTWCLCMVSLCCVLQLPSEGGCGMYERIRAALLACARQLHQE